MKRTAEHNRKIAEALKGRKFSDEHRANISKAKTGKPIDVSVRRKYIGSDNPFFGKTHTAESLAAIGMATTLRRWRKLSKYGISQQKYEEMLSTGFKWCSIHKGFIEAQRFTMRQTLCDRCARNIMLIRTYNVSSEWYDKVFAEQNGVCALCDSGPLRTRKYLSVDHDHTTGAVRGLLCGKCNTAYERVDAIEGWLERAQQYRRKFSDTSLAGAS